MPTVTLQSFFATATQTAADELSTAYARLPEEKRAWSPAWNPDEKGRPALNQWAECIIINGFAADLLQSRVWPADMNEQFGKGMAEVEAMDLEAQTERLGENTRRVIAAISAVPDNELTAEIVLPWKTDTVAETLGFAYWNMTYHLGQINYIASLLGCLP